MKRPHLPPAKSLAAGAAMWLLTLPCHLHGHEPGKVSQETLLFLNRPTLSLRHETVFGETITKTRVIQFDADRNGSLSAQELDALLAAHAKEVTGNLRLRLNEQESPLAYLRGNARLLPDGHLAVRLALELDLASLPDGRHRLSLTNKVFPAPLLERTDFGVHAGPGSETVTAQAGGTTLDWSFLLAATLPGDPKVQDEWAPGSSPPKKSGPPDRLSQLLQTETLSPLFVLVALALAAGFGAVHALGPGHGKAMVAAYLVGTRGRIRDAVILGGIVTLTHVSSVVILGLVALFLSESIMPEQLYPWLSLCSGALIWLTGFWMLARRALGGEHDHSHHHHHHHHHHHEHEHEHGHSGSPAHGHHHPHHEHEHGHSGSHAHGHHHQHHHEHEHEHSHSGSHAHGHHSHDHSPHHPHSHPPDRQVSFGSLLAMGLSGGMVPCPSALVVLLGAIAMHRIGFGLALILAFSLGLAAVLILIGILVVKSGDLLSRSLNIKESRWVQALPIASAGLILLIGTFLMVQALRATGIL